MQIDLFMQCIYKTLTKIFDNCLKHLMLSLVGPLQTSFVKGRNFVDNYVILQEIVHSFGSMKGANGYVLLKLDHQKAYDKIK